MTIRSVYIFPELSNWRTVIGSENRQEVQGPGHRAAGSVAAAAAPTHHPFLCPQKERWAAKQSAHVQANKGGQKPYSSPPVLPCQPGSVPPQSRADPHAHPDRDPRPAAGGTAQNVSQGGETSHRDTPGAPRDSSETQMPGGRVWTCAHVCLCVCTCTCMYVSVCGS